MHLRLPPAPRFPSPAQPFRHRRRGQQPISHTRSSPSNIRSANGACPARTQPPINAQHVESMPTLGKHPHYLPFLRLAQADGAHFVGDFCVPPVNKDGHRSKNAVIDSGTLAVGGGATSNPAAVTETSVDEAAEESDGDDEDDEEGEGEKEDQDYPGVLVEAFSILMCDPPCTCAAPVDVHGSLSALLVRLAAGLYYRCPSHSGEVSVLG
ncbi:hypothetical protein HPP92_019606 [Vanilla planifolia]|uniref:Uncharacterized protein n=1 Tax=Vanilla planifolia TaxID=51239 RepID=A0A835UKX2_VANPL|nr:hypothetical protein HPP92_019606 [Vanilla planifolia]